ncbi:permease prefix domain 1-containing protein [Actinotalea sp.]|uniref:permease prefix domain 1-containing protein n=1 Tax=Actinotalea sp. TaxID=1872145 RepID=UPI002D1FBEE7|nr:permease prefix domain 1-containing protein [Actinotalea sp.]
MSLGAELEEQIERWRGFAQRRQAISVSDVEELEDHLRSQISDLQATGLDEGESFLVAMKRLGDLDAVSREYAREHSERLWKQLVLVPQGSAGAGGAGGTSPWVEVAFVLAAAVGAGLAVKAGMWWDREGLQVAGSLGRTLSLLVAPFLAAYLGWKRRLSLRAIVAVLVPFLVLAILLNAYPFAPGGSTDILAALHAPVVLWVLIGVVYVGGRWRSDARRMDFVRFTGELAVYYALLGMGGAVLIGLTAGALGLVGVDFEPVLEQWILPFAVPGALVVAAWLVEAKQSVVENIAPVLTRVFTPLTTLMLLVLLGVLAAAGGVVDVDREVLILMDAILVLVLCLVLYSISARDPLSGPGLFDGLQLVLVLAALAVDMVMLAAMVTRIAEFGSSPNKVAALGLNVLLLVHLAGTAWLTAGFVRGRGSFAAVERWQTRYLPVYGGWAAVVVVVFGPVFGFV